MKKIILSLAVISSIGLSAMAMPNSQSEDSQKVVNYYSNLLKDKITGAKVQYMGADTFRDYQLIKIKANIKGSIQEHFVFIKDGLMFGDIIDLNTMQSYRNLYHSDKLMSVVKNSKDYISLGANNEKEIWVFSDVLCPYCKEHSKKLPELIKDTKVNIVFVNSIGGDVSAKKIIAMEKELKKAKSDKDKLTIIDKYFSYTPDNTLNATDNEIKTINERSNKYKEAGLEYVPFIINGGKK